MGPGPRFEVSLPLRSGVVGFVLVPLLLVPACQIGPQCDHCPSGADFEPVGVMDLSALHGVTDDPPRLRFLVTADGGPEPVETELPMTGTVRDGFTLDGIVTPGVPCVCAIDDQSSLADVEVSLSLPEAWDPSLNKAFPVVAAPYMGTSQVIDLWFGLSLQTRWN